MKKTIKLTKSAVNNIKTSANTIKNKTSTPSLTRGQGVAKVLRTRRVIKRSSKLNLPTFNKIRDFLTKWLFVIDLMNLTSWLSRILKVTILGRIFKAYIPALALISVVMKRIGKFSFYTYALVSVIILTIIVIAHLLDINIEISSSTLVYPFYAIWYYIETYYHNSIEFIYNKFKSLFLAVTELFHTPNTPSSVQAPSKPKFRVSHPVDHSVVDDMRNTYSKVKDSSIIKNSLPNYEDDSKWSKKRIALYVLLGVSLIGIALWIHDKSIINNAYNNVIDYITNKWNYFRGYRPLDPDNLPTPPHFDDDLPEPINPGIGVSPEGSPPPVITPTCTGDTSQDSLQVTYRPYVSRRNAVAGSSAAAATVIASITGVNEEQNAFNSEEDSDNDNESPLTHTSVSAANNPTCSPTFPPNLYRTTGVQDTGLRVYRSRGDMIDSQLDERERRVGDELSQINARIAELDRLEEIYQGRINARVRPSQPVQDYRSQVGYRRQDEDLLTRVTSDPLTAALFTQDSCTDKDEFGKFVSTFPVQDTGRSDYNPASALNNARNDLQRLVPHRNLEPLQSTYHEQVDAITPNPTCTGLQETGDRVLTPHTTLTSKSNLPRIKGIKIRKLKFKRHILNNIQEENEITIVGTDPNGNCFNPFE